MAENVNINVTENIDQVNVVASEIVEVVDLNLYATTEDVTINVTEEIIQVNVNKITATNITKTSDLINDGEDGINPFITLQDIPPVEGFVPYTGATQNVDLGEFELKAGQLTLDTSPTGTAAVGTTRWNNTLGSSETTLKGGSVILKNGVDLVARVVNKVTPNTTLTKANYAAVRISGAQGQRLAVAYAQANNDLNSADTIGLVCETIPTNQEGFILTVGQLENINTTGNLQGETWNDGDVIYLSPTVAGKLTNIKPTAPQHIVIIGYVEYAHSNNGKLYVKIMNGWELEELHNVSSTNYTTPIDTDSVLTYDVTNSLWKRLSWSNIKSNLKTYFDTIYQAALGYTPENVANKATNLTSPDNTKYPTTQAVVDGLATKQNTLTNPVTGTGANGQVAFWNGTNSQTGDNGLFWDNANKRLGVGSTTFWGSTKSLIVGTSSESRLGVSGTGRNGVYLGLVSNASQIFSYDYTLNQPQNLFINSFGGNVSIGSNLNGARLDVRAQGALSTDIAFRVRNSADTADLMSVNGLGTTTIGNTTAGNVALNVRGNIVANTSSSATVTVGIDASNWGIVQGSGNGLELRTVSSFDTSNGRILILPQTNSNIINTVRGTGVIIFNTANTERMRITDTGNVVIGATTAGARLDVRAQGALSTDIAFRVRNSADTANLISVDGTGLLSTPSITLGTPSFENNIRFGGNNTRIFNSVSDNSLNFQSSFSSNTVFRFTTNSSLPNANTSGTNTFMSLPIGFAPTSGTGTWTQLSLTATINQTGGANGITRGLFINPTLTSAFDFRAIEVSNGGAYINTTNVQSSAILQADSTTKGFLPPRMTNAQRLAIASPAIGLMVYCTDATEGLYINKSTGWTFII